MAARTGSARKSIANSRLEGQGGPGEATVHPPDLCKVLGSTSWLEACLTALAVKRYRPGLRRPDGRLRGGGALRVQLQLDRQGQAVRALRPPSSANIHRFHASRSDLPVVTRRHRRRTKTPLNLLEIQFGFGAWKINVLVGHIPPYE